jgi:hypothetical protein
MNNISILLSSQEWVFTNNIHSTDMGKINILLCATASTQSGRSAYISVTMSVCKNGCMDCHNILHQNVSLNFIDRLSVGITWDNDIGGLTSVIIFFCPTANLNSSKHARDASQVKTMKRTFFQQTFTLSFKRQNY